MRDAYPMRRRAGTALVELLVIIGIIVVLIAILIPMFMSARMRASQARCMSNLRWIGQAMLDYAADNHGRFPSAAGTVGERVRPDVSNSGFAAADPFGPGGPVANNVPAAIFLLIRTGRVSPSVFVCPNTAGSPDALDGFDVQLRSNFTDVRRNLGYSMQNPYAEDAALLAGFKWGRTVSDDFPLMADLNPGSLTPDENLPGLDLIGLLRGRYVGNSNNHDREGQNVLYADGRVEFQTTPRAGINHDHIYMTLHNKLLASPQDGMDSILLPAEN